jgi:hypothetical protein
MKTALHLTGTILGLAMVAGGTVALAMLLEAVFFGPHPQATQRTPVPPTQTASQGGAPVVGTVSGGM